MSLAPLYAHGDPTAYRVHVRARTGREGRLSHLLRRQLVDGIHQGQAQAGTCELGEQIRPAARRGPDLVDRRLLAALAGPATGTVA
jgi:hypothetical protein